MRSWIRRGQKTKKVFQVRLLVADGGHASVLRQSRQKLGQLLFIVRAQFAGSVLGDGEGDGFFFAQVADVVAENQPP